MRQIIVRAPNWIGDAIMTTPALNLLKMHFPDSAITVLGKKQVLAVFQEHPAVAKVMPYLAERPLDIWRQKQAARLIRKKYHLAVLFPNSFASALFFWLASIPQRAGYATDMRKMLLTQPVPVPPNKKQQHEIFYYINLIQKLDQKKDIELKEYSLILNVPEKGIKGAQKILRALNIQQEKEVLIGFNPGAAYGPAKCWPVKKFARLAQKLFLTVKNCRILIFGTEREREIGEEIGKGAPICHNLAGKTTLPEAMGLIKMLDALVTNDSGLMHVGAALNTPLAAIFGSTNPVTTGPWSPNSKIIRHELPCSPCLKRTCPSNFECMEKISVHEVFEVVRKLLANGKM